MARIDKYDPVSGGFRARLGFQPDAAEVGDVIGVTIDNNGLAQKASATNCEAVICLSSLLEQGAVVDCMTDGEIVDVGAGNNVTGFAKGAKAFAAASGAIGVTAPASGANGVRIGTFIEAWRLVVRVQTLQGA